MYTTSGIEWNNARMQECKNASDKFYLILKRVYYKTSAIRVKQNS
jgi:hypothetical protein